jgi:integrase
LRAPNPFGSWSPTALASPCGTAVRTAYTVLRAVLDTAVRDKAIAQNQAQAVRRPRVTGKEAAYLTPDQVRSLLDAAEGSRNAVVSNEGR